MIKIKITDKAEIEQLYLQDGATVKSITKIYKTNDRTITKILNESENKDVLYKLKHPNKGKKIPKPKRNEGKTCEICKSTNNVCLNNLSGTYLCQRHRSQMGKYGKILERTKFDKNEVIEYDDYIEIILTDKNFKETGRALVSKHNINKINKHSWSLRKDGYVTCRANKENILLHRFIMEAREDECVDHINRNKSDNRDENLRKVCYSENEVNRGMQYNNTSGVTGVTWDKSRGKWKAQLNIYNKSYNLGRFDDFEEAVKARQQAELKYHGEFIPIERQEIYNIQNKLNEINI